MVMLKKKAKTKTASKPAAKSKSKASSVKGLVEVDSVDPDLDLAEQMLININGEPGSGKTFVALSASKYWPSKLPNIKQILLRDTIHVGWDAAAMIGAVAQKIKAAYMISVPQLLASGRKSGKPKCADITEALEMVAENVYEICDKDPNITLVIDDTITRMDKYLLAFWAHKDQLVTSRGGEIDTRHIYRCMFACHHEYQSARATLPSGITSVFLFHGKMLYEEQAKGEAKKAIDRKKIGGLGVQIVPNITGQSLDLYTGEASIELACVPSVAPKGQETKRYLYTVPTGGLRTKNRLQECLDEREPAHLGKILAKIRKACA